MVPVSISVKSLYSEESIDDLNKCGPFGPLTAFSSIWKSNKVRPVVSGVVASSGVEAVEILPVPNYRPIVLVAFI